MAELVAAIRQAIPALSKDLHKGQYGKVAIIGGSLEYTGAPYYAAISALKTGVDLCHVICTVEAAIPIKCYSPELIVHPLLTPAPDAIDRIAAVLPRIDAVVVGPGLGREPFVLDLVKQVVGVAKARALPIVLDGDALYLLSTDLTLIAGYSHAVLTPNIVEYGRLCVATGLLKELNLVLAALIPPSQLSQKLGHVAILRKGEVDMASDGVSTFTNTLDGSPRRCGGQGDVVAGTVGAFLAWHRIACHGDETSRMNPMLRAAMGGALLTRQSSVLAFAKKGGA
ncbi:YjeF [Saprolegnia parasitica CBS 223.65]|uniref:ATP-dependent (S)-NAD(P)H-hydrate dehydratase n=1 Tax=Saprolegnia parasitica (strain CBS 223.65) TaxID=695850 RepID=A0A067D1J9_SAPPC|nr:YjeF [Saprolegnia parasitica CBS 223.65]KDO35375.1 YjeF [Saprolegnia parasitica CBS 223.65]|eukprot:XP_012193720.1 YjeF [Saprolegnia parasitica CBS 223.65]